MRYGVDPERVAYRFVDGEAVLINTDTSFYYSLNPVGAYVWKLLTESPRSADEITRIVSQEYGQSEDSIAGDVTSLLGELKQEGLVQEE